MFGILGISLGMLGISFVPRSTYLVGIVLAAFIGVAVALANGSLGPLLQTKVPPEVQGRVFTVLSSISQGLMPIGLFLSAPIADHFGVPAAYLIGGGFGLVIVIYGFLEKRLMTIDDQLPGGKLIESDNQPQPEIISS
jgi:DHA3 family macrolide efflux protein-like MFS transporter